MRIFFSEITGHIVAEDELWKLYQPIRHKRRYSEFKEILGYRGLMDMSKEEREAVMKTMNHRALLFLLRGLFNTINRLKMERDTLQSVIDQIDPMILGEAARKAGKK